MKSSATIPSVVQLNYLFQRACLLDLSALKPGNVGWHGAGHNMLNTDFVLSAAACGKVLCSPGGTLGERVLSAIRATQSVVNCNTNLGIILLCAPVIQAMPLVPKHGGDLRASVQEVLESSTIVDAERVFEAIRLARPGGMGQVENGDISENPEISLLEAMALAVGRDAIAAEYCSGFRLLFQEIVPSYLAFCAQWQYHAWASVGIYLLLLGSYPDSLISRRHGLGVSEEVTATVSSLFADIIKNKKGPHLFESELLVFDKDLKRRGINPGTTADLVVAGVFISSLEQMLSDGRSIKCSEDVIL